VARARGPARGLVPRRRTSRRRKSVAAEEDMLALGPRASARRVGIAVRARDKRAIGPLDIGGWKRRGHRADCRTVPGVTVGSGPIQQVVRSDRSH